MSDARGRTVAGQLELARSSFAAGDELTYTVANTGDLPIMLGAAYALERFDNGRWTVTNPNAGFRAWGRRLGPGQQTQLSTRLPPALPAGRYRLRKRLSVDRDPYPGLEWLAQSNIEPYEAIVEFTVNAA
jgi:hypothetical protein